MRRTKLLKKTPLDKLMDLKVDFAFKQLFGIEKKQKDHHRFLNAILQRTLSDQIIDISFKNVEASGEYKEDKASRLDLLVITNAGEWINIEMQFTNKYDMVKRSLYYYRNVANTPIMKGMNYKELSPVIAINIINFDLFDRTDRFHTTYHLYEDTEKFKLTNVMELHFIEMTKLIRDWQADKLDPWNDLLGMVDHRNGKVYEDIFKELEDIAMKDKTLYEAIENWEVLSQSHEQMIAYQGRMKRIRDEEAAANEARELKLEAHELKLEANELKLEANELKLEAHELKLEATELKLEATELMADAAKIKLEAVESIRQAEERMHEASKSIYEAQERIRGTTELRDREIIFNMYEEKLPVESIAQLTKIPIDKVIEIIKSAPQ